MGSLPPEVHAKLNECCECAAELKDCCNDLHATVSGHPALAAAAPGAGDAHNVGFNPAGFADLVAALPAAVAPFEAIFAAIIKIAGPPGP